MTKRNLAYLIVMCQLGPLALTACEGELADDGPAVPAALDLIAQAALGSGNNDTGWYYQLKSVSNSLCADVEGRALTDGARIVQFGCSSGPNQRFYFRALSSSTYQLMAQHSASCIRVSNGGTADGTAIVQDGCARSGTDQAGTVFTARLLSGSTTQYQLVDNNSGKCVRSPNSTSGSGLTLATCSTSTSFLWTLPRVSAVAASDSNGRWSGVINTANVIPISAAVLPNRKVLIFASWKGTSFAGSGSLDQTVTVLFDPATNTAGSARTVTNTAHNMFCPGTAMIGDGRLVVSGGDDSYTTANSIYNYSTNAWTTGKAMTERRWYNTSVTLADGRVLTLGGNRSTGGTGDGEIYNPSTNAWTFMSALDIGPLVSGTSSDSRAMEHPRLSVAPDGRVFASGPSPNMQWYNTAGSGSVSSAGRRGDDETSQNDITVVYDIGKLLKAGGNPSYDRGTATFIPSSRNSYIIDFNGTPSVTKVEPMKYPRNFANGVVLPNGTVFVAGGLDNAKGFSDDGKILPAELFDPRTRTWKELPAAAVARPYHSTALLLPDGRVMVGGGGLCSGNDSCSVNHPNLEIFSPSYLYAATTRPTITSAPTTVTANGGTFTVGVTGNVTRFTLVRMSSVTHSVNTDQRLVPLDSTGSGGSRTVTAPANKNIAPPGYYMLFALDGDVPSVSAIVRIQ